MSAVFGTESMYVSRTFVENLTPGARCILSATLSTITKKSYLRVWFRFIDCCSSNKYAVSIPISVIHLLN